VLAALYIATAVYALYCTQMLQIRWRRWLTERYSRDWLAGRFAHRATVAKFHHRRLTLQPETRSIEDGLLTENLTDASHAEMACRLLAEMPRHGERPRAAALPTSMKRSSRRQHSSV
jgi:hypothetical protein